MIKHVLVWKLRTPEDAAPVAALLDSLPPAIPHIRSFTHGRDALPDPRPPVQWDGALVADFDSTEDLFAYLGDPFHVEVADKLMAHFSEVAAADLSIA